MDSRIGPYSGRMTDFGSVVQWVTDSAAQLPTALVWGLGFAFSVLESGLGLGFFVPGETVVTILAATFDSIGPVLVMLVAVAIGGSLGDHVGYTVGRRLGPRLRETRLIRKLGQHNWDRAVGVIERRGAIAVFLTRLVPVVRTLTPAAAGVGRVPYRQFLPASLLGAFTWSALYVGIGFLVRSSLDVVQEYLGAGGWIVLGIVLIGAVVALVVRIARKRAPADDPRAVIGDGADAGTMPPTAGVVGTLRYRLFQQDEWRTIPNAVSAVRILLLPVFGALLVGRVYWAAIVVLLLVFISDFVDGFVARRFHMTSALGAWLDPVADRLTVVIVGFSFVAAQIVPWQTVAILLIPDVLMGIWALVAFNGAPDVKVAFIGKIRTTLLFVGLFSMLVGFAIPSAYKVLVGAGFVLYLLGIIGHYMAMTHNARGMLALWQKERAAA